MFLMAILKVAALLFEGQLNYINSLTTRKELIISVRFRQKHEKIYLWTVSPALVPPHHMHLITE
jgi:hypothetical protein